jgi:hypothetical protein
VASWRDEPPRVTGSWHAYRQVAPETAPLFHSAGEPVPSQRDGRWHVQGEGYAQYMALEPAGAWSELIRYERIRVGDRAAEYRRKLWLIYVEESEIADLSSFAAYDKCGLDPRLAVGDHADSQRLAIELREAGYRGLLSPSAALSGATNLTLFGERYEKVLNSRVDAWTNPNPRVRLACNLLAESGPPGGLITETCFVGMEHEAYREYLRAAGIKAPGDPP